MSYKTYLRAVGRKPIPAYDKLRTVRAPGDVEMPAATTIWWRGNVPVRGERVVGGRAGA